MSVLVKEVSLQKDSEQLMKEKIFLLCKGADDVILKRLAKSNGVS